MSSLVQRLCLRAVLIALSVAPVAVADVSIVKQASYSWSYGCPDANGTLDLFAKASYFDGYRFDPQLGYDVPTKESYSYGKAIAKVTLFNVTAEAARAEVSAIVQKTKTDISASRLYLRLGPFVVADEQSSGSSYWEKGFYKTIYEAEKSFLISGVVPVTVKGTVGAGVDVGLDATLDAQRVTTRAGGWARPYGRGTAEAYAGVDWANVGIECVLDFASVRNELNVSATSSKVGGNYVYTIDPVSLRLYLTATTPWKKYRQEMWNWAYPIQGPYTKVLM